MIGIKEISTYLPSKFLSNVDVKDKFDVTEGFIKDKIGMITLAQKKPEQETSDLAMAVVKRLFEQSELTPDQVECLIVVTQNPDGGGLPHTSAILHNKLQLNKNCCVFDVSLGCSGYVQGLSIIKGIMESQGFESGILVTADPYSKIINSSDRDTSMIFGDGATATWVGSSPSWQIGASDFGIDSSKNGSLKIDESGQLFMNGRSVFNFAAVEVPKSVERVLDQASLKIEDIDLVVLHQGSKYIVDAIAKRIGSEGRTPFVAKDYGNTISSSIPIILAENIPDSTKTILLSGFGVGLSWATCIIERA